jgi:hypothetical protein
VSSRTALALLLLVSLILVAWGGIAGKGLMLAVLAGWALVLISLPLLGVLDKNLGADLRTIFLSAVAVRWLVSTMINQLVYPTYPVLFAPDEWTYDNSGWLYALSFRNIVPHPWGGQNPGGIVSWVAATYYVVGHEIMVPKLMNCVLGGWTTVMTAVLAGRAFGKDVAKRAGFLAAFFPSLVLWSSVLMKDTSTLFGAQISLAAFLSLREKINPVAFVAMTFGLFVVGIDRAYEVFFVGLSILASFIIVADRRLMRNLFLFCVFSGIVLYVVRSTSNEMVVTYGDTASMLEQVQNIRIGFSAGTGSAMSTELVDTNSVSGLLLWIPLGLIYFFLAPFPFTGHTIISISTSPEMIGIYALMPAIGRSLRRELKQRRKSFMPLFFYLLVSAIGWSMVITNVGTVYRYRAQVFFVIVILIAADQIHRREERRLPALHHLAPSS